MSENSHNIVRFGDIITLKIFSNKESDDLFICGNNNAYN